MPQPYNYNLGVASPADLLMQADQYNLARKQVLAQMQKQAFEIQKYQEEKQRVDLARKRATELLNNPESTAQDLALVSLEHPDVARALDESLKSMTKKEREADRAYYYQVDSALDNKDLESVKVLLNEKMKAAINSKDLQTEKEVANSLDVLEKDPRKFAAMVKARLIADVGPEDYNKTKGYRMLSKEEKKQAGLPSTKVYQVSPSGKTEEVTGGGVVVNIPPQLEKGYQAVYDEEGNFIGTEPIPGGAVEAKLKKAPQEALKKYNFQQKAVTDALTILQNSVLPVTGVAKNYVPKLLSQKGLDLGAKIKTITSRLGFEELQAMRDSSPSGAGLGAVSDAENARLDSALVNLEQSQNKNQLRDNLVFYQKTLNEIVHGDPYYNFRNSNWVKAYEDKTGKTLTDKDFEALMKKGVYLE